MLMVDDAFHIVSVNRKSDGVVIYIKKKLNGRICETKSMVVDGVLECVTVEFGINRNKTALVSCVVVSCQLCVQVPWFKFNIF